jgi:Family of unknown function (DUF6275)
MDTTTDPNRFLDTARSRVSLVSGFDIDVLYIVWFAKTLQNWKALISTDAVSGTYWEVTHNGDKHETYVDTYSKVSNVAVPD